MTVNTTSITSGPYLGNDVNDTFSYGFRITDKSEIKIFETDAAGVETELVVDTDYTLTGIGDAAGGTAIRTAGNLPTGYTWYIRSDYDETQLTSFRSQGAFFPGLHEDAMDKLTFLIQQILDRVSRTFRLSDSDTSGLSLELPPPEPLKFVRVNAANTALEYASGTTSVLAEDVTTDTADLQTVLDSLSYPTVAAMIADTGLTVGMKVRTLGYYTAGDGGGNDYLIVPAGTGTDDGGNYIDIATYQAKGLFSNGVRYVKQWGALGDGATDDALFVAAAIQGTDGSGGELVFNQGRYMIRSTMVLTGAFRKLRGEGLAVGIPGVQLITDVEDLTILVLNGETYAIENISFIGPGLTRTGAGNGVGLRIETSSGAVQTDDVRLDRLWFAGWKEAGLKVERFQGGHINNCTFEFCGYGISAGTGDATSQFWQNEIRGCRFYRNIRGISVSGDPAAAANASLNINNIISDCVFDIHGDSAFASQQAAIYFGVNSNFNIIANCQFPKNVYQDIIMDRCHGNIVSDCYSFRAGRQSLWIQDCEDISISDYQIQNWNNDFGTHAIDFPAVDIDGSTVTFDGLRTRVYGASSSTNAVRLSNSSTVDCSRTVLLGGTGAAVTKDGGSAYENITPVAGTFTPTIVGSTTAGAHTYSVQDAQYRRSGRDVFFKLSVLLTAKDAAMAGSAQINGLPFAVETSTAEIQAQVKYNDINLVSGQECVASASAGTTHLTLYRVNPGAGGTAFTVDSSQIGNNTRVDISGTYMTSDL